MSAVSKRVHQDLLAALEKIDALTRAAACSRKIDDGAPFHFASEGGKWKPMSPSPSAP